MAGKLGFFRFLRRFWGAGLGEITRPVVQFEVLFSQIGIDDFDADAPIGTIAMLIRGRVSNQVSFAQIALDLRKGGGQILFVAWKEGAATGGFADLLQGAFVDAIGITIANTDGINQGLGLKRPVDGFLHAHLADGVFAIGQENDGAARVFGRAFEQLIRGCPDRVPDGG